MWKVDKASAYATIKTLRCARPREVAYIGVVPREARIRHKPWEGAHARECGHCIAKSGAVRRPASGRPRRFQARSIRSRRAHVPAPGEDALAGDLARLDDPSGPHRLYRPGAATHGGGPAEERR